MSTVLLSSAYFAPIQWYQKLYRNDTILIECYDSFQKQTYRNRCIISSVNGPQTLSVPIEKHSTFMNGNLSSLKMKDVRISNHGNWRHTHWNALKTSYGESPFFMFYADDIRPFFEKGWTFLYDFNMEITEKILELLSFKTNIKPTKKYIPIGSEKLQGVLDFREVISAKHPKQDKDFSLKPYYQVYKNRHGFIENLSILDLLFNMGNESLLYL